MAITPAMVVDPPEPRGLRYGLFNVINGPYDLPLPHGVAGGVTYQPVSCGHAHIHPNMCHADIRYAKEFDANDSFITANPFIVYSSLQCGTAGSSPESLDAKVRRRLANGEQTQAEVALAVLLAGAATPVASPDPTLTGVIGGLEQWLYGSATASYGNVGYLHASPRVAAYAMEENLIVKDGPLLRTHMGSIWVFGGGYPDTDPATIYISGQVTAWRDPQVFVTPPDQTLDLVHNQYYMLAERAYAVTYDCVAASSTFDWNPAS